METPSPLSQTPQRAPGSPAADIAIRPLRESDLPTAERTCRLAFGTAVGAPEPETFWADRDYVRSRWRADPTAAFAAEIGGDLVGSNFAANWGSVGVLGPLTVHPDLWDRGVGRRLVEAAIGRFATWGTRHIGLFTFAHSAKHVAMYQRFGFWPRFLTAIMAMPVRRTTARAEWSRYSDLPEAEREACLGDCRDLTDALYAGLYLAAEIRAVHAQHLGDTVLLWDDAGLVGVAICHAGPRSEAGAGACLIKFGAVQPRPGTERAFGRLLDACEALAAAEGLPRLLAGVNLARHEAYRHLLARGFRTELQGVAMHRPNEAGYSRPGAYVIDDWR
jgi:predicted N-acetyltransferase YhbS